MPERKWLNYSGQSVDDLLALAATHRIDSLVLAFEQAIYSRVDDENGFNEVEETVLAVEALEREVNNGGFDQFFVNTPEFAAVIVAALERIDCPRTADITRRAVGALHLAELTRETIEEVIFDDNPERKRTFAACDVEFFHPSEDVAERLFAFIRANKDRIRL